MIRPRDLLLIAYSRVPTSIRFRIMNVLVRLEGRLDEPGSIKNLLNLTDPLEKSIGQSCARQAGGVHPKHELINYHQYFVERIKPREKVVDIGCGIGILAHAVASKAGAEIYGIDICAKSIQEAKKRFDLPNLHFVHGDATLFFPANKCHVVILSNVLEHIDNRENLIRRVVEGLRPERLLIRVPIFDRHWLVALKSRMGLDYYLDSTHLVEKTSSDWLKEFHSYGLELLHYQVCWGELWSEWCHRSSSKKLD